MEENPSNIPDTYTDINPFNRSHKNTEARTSDVKQSKDCEGQETPEDQNSPLDNKFEDLDNLNYDMSGNKYYLVLNHYKFLPTKFYNFKEPEPRYGTEQDVKAIKRVFEGQLNFVPFQKGVYNDLELSDLWKVLVDLRDFDHSQTACLVIFILTHGNKDGVLNAADRSYELNDVLQLFEYHPGLATKPKLFFVQACRGAEVDDGIDYVDGLVGESTKSVPAHADFFIMRSTVEDHRSYRTRFGSWMIQELCDVVEKYHTKRDILQLATVVNSRIAYNYTTYTPSNRSTHNKKQIPEVTFRLTKLLYLNDKVQ